MEIWNEQAALKATEYLAIMPFPHRGLIEQLEHDGFTPNQAEHGVKAANADWNEQAALKATEYLAIMPFSHRGLIEQLEHDGFTPNQAQHGVKAAAS